MHFNDATVPDVSYEYFTPSNDTDNEHQIWNASGAVEYDEKGRVIKEGMTEFIQGDIQTLLESVPKNDKSFYRVRIRR